ncbi:hypothetical protein ORIO_12345 [Cereibacter azotoformans]|uniref:hypothetical protein n=1 Tax=Cereibacter azotoformans TaxID=43057 RepID=UPI001EECBC40|nr:hypothetical protein [Cereibacter azotoformans]ULB10693.1 hypothetical protein ORIO_12345 [Cereibacter azotoformans]
MNEIEMAAVTILATLTAFGAGVFQGWAMGRKASTTCASGNYRPLTAPASPDAPPPPKPTDE